MNPNQKENVEGRIERLLESLGIERAHFAARISVEVGPLLSRREEIFSSLTLVDPNRLEGRQLAPLGNRAHIVAGERGMSGSAVEAARPDMPEAIIESIPNHYGVSWSDTARLFPDLMVRAIDDFVSRADAERPATRLNLPPGEDEVAGLTYRVLGSGPALVLLPLMLAASQWEPIAGRLSEKFTVIVLGGPHLGMVAMLEARAQSPGYLRVVRSVIDEIGFRAGWHLLDVGCGTGALDRWLARYTRGENPITALDLSPYFLREARSMTEKAGLADIIKFCEGNAESLPFADEQFDVTMSHTVMEECDADRMLAEMIRVTRPGGTVAVMTRSVDLPVMWNLPLPHELKTRVEAPLHSVGEKGCADASLYQRFARSSLTGIRGFPHYMAIDGVDTLLWRHYEPQALQLLSERETRLWNEAKIRAAAEGTAIFARPHHCAIGIKPG